MSYGSSGTVGAGFRPSTLYGAAMTNIDDPNYFPDPSDPVAMKAWRARRPWQEKLWGLIWYRTRAYRVWHRIRWAPYRLVRRIDAARGMSVLLGSCTDFEVTNADWPRHGNYDWRVVAYGLPFSRGSGRGKTLLQASRRAVAQMERHTRRFYEANGAKSL